MASVENRVVQMTFDNASFERKLDTTIKSLDKLEQSLNFSNATKGMNSLKTAGKGFNLGPMSASIEGISTKFLALSAIGITVLSNLANRAVDAGIRIAKSLTLDNVIGGFQEYEINMKSIQTILANTKADGTNLEQVNAALDELNSYADQTIYNFAQMARNIGTFTAAGVDLKTSTDSIKGIANAAAISGSTSQQASTAMYQLSQAIASGSLKLMDWNSVVNAGMGGEVMQRALFTTGKAMGTLVDVPIDQTFDAWKDAGNTFRESLQEGWITTDVLTTTLKGFSGEAEAAELAAMGFTDTMIAEFQELGETGIEAATKVRTMTQLFDTLGEAIGSGWSQTFRIVLGDFEEATDLFTGLSSALDEMVSNSANARNELLQGWKDLGGRTTAIAALHEAFIALSEIFAPIKEAFRDIFPPLTSERLVELTNSFRVLALRMRPSAETVDNLKRIFTGFFNAIKVGGQLLKRGASALFDFFGVLTGAGEGNTLEFLAKIGDALAGLTADGVINRAKTLFESAFGAIARAIESPQEVIEDLKDTLLEFFTNLKENIKVPEIFAGVFARLEQRFKGLSKLGDNIGDIWAPIRGVFTRIGSILDETGQVLKDWFSNLGSEMADAADPGDFDAVLDVVNVGLLGGITALLGKLVTGGFKFDLGHGFFDEAADALEEVGGVLKAMQADLKANALLKIAGAIGILAISITLLASIDSAALTRALVAISVGLGQLVGTFAIFSKLALGPTTTAKFAALGVGLVLLAGALLLLSVAVKILSTMSWEEIAKGLTAVTALLGGLSAAVAVMSSNSAGMIRAGISIIALSIGLNLLALAMKIFATMSWEEMAKGLTGVAGGLTAIVTAMNLMPTKGMARIGLNLLLVGTALNLVATAALIFATMSWEEMGKGMAGIAVGLLAVAGAMHLMPATLPLTATGMILIGGALIVIAEAVKLMSGLSWEELGRGLAGLAGSLLILAGAAHIMSGALLGAIAITIMAAGLTVMAQAVREFSGMSLKELAKGLLGMAITMGVLAGMAYLLAPAAGALALFGGAMLLLGAGFALFGIGANLTARAFKVLAESGKAGIEVLMFFIDQLIERIPELAASMAEGLIEMGQVFLEAAPVLIEQLGVIVAQLIETLRDLIPEFTGLIIDLMEAMFETIRAASPEFVETGFQLLLDLLTGIRDNIGEIISMGGEILRNFLDGVREEIPPTVRSVVDLFVTLVETVSYEMGRLIPTLMIGIGASFVTGVKDGIDEQMPKLKSLWEGFPSDVLGWIGDTLGTLLGKGVDLMQGLWDGISSLVETVANFFIDLPGNILGWIGDLGSTLASKGLDLIEGFYTAVKNFATRTMFPWFFGLPRRIIGWIGETFETLGSLGKNLMSGLYNGVIDKINNLIKPWFSGLLSTIVGWIGSGFTALTHIGKNLIIGLWNGINSLRTWVTDKITQFAKDVVGPFGFIFELGSPSRLTEKYGKWLAEGLVIGLDAQKHNAITSAEAMANAVITALDMEIGDDIVISPVLDLTELEKEASRVGKIVNFDAQITPTTSFEQAQSIANTEFADADTDENQTTGSTQVTFEQTINAPTELSTSEIYKQTRNVITLAKEELSIP